MRGLKKYYPEERFLLYCRKIQMRMKGQHPELDQRMSEEERHRAVLMVLGFEPVIGMAKLLSLCLDKRSLWYGKVPVETVFRMGRELHEAINPAPDRNSRKRSDDENQFELN